MNNNGHLLGCATCDIAAPSMNIPSISIYIFRFGEFVYIFMFPSTHYRHSIKHVIKKKSRDEINLTIVWLLLMFFSFYSDKIGFPMNLLFCGRLYLNIQI